MHDAPAAAPPQDPLPGPVVQAPPPAARHALHGVFTAFGARRAPLVARLFAVLEMILVSGIPTQVLLTLILVFGFNQPLFDGSAIPLQFFATLSLLDTAAITLLIRLFLALSRENSRDVFIGRRPIGGEIVRGLLLTPFVFIGVTLIVIGLRTFAPSLHTVAENPISAYLNGPVEAAIFLVVVVLAGGIREEVQRAFILYRYRQCLAGTASQRFWFPVGVVGYSAIFGALHFNQGWDVAIAVGSLGLLWGILYARRQSAVMTMTNHAAFDAVQVIQGALARALGQ